LRGKICVNLDSYSQCEFVLAGVVAYGEMMLATAELSGEHAHY
jgi:hypothetical protein